MPRLPRLDVVFCAVFLAGSVVAIPGQAGDQPQWGERYSRNMVSPEKGLPESFDPETGENVKWSVSLGKNNYSSPVVASGRVLIGANSEALTDPRYQGDCSVLFCLNETDGSLYWQLVVPRIGGDIYLDWPRLGMCSPPTVEKDRVYTVTNRFEVVCLDLNGQSNGNDGPYQDEGHHMAQSGEAPLDVTSLDADIIWLFDMPSEAGMHPHDGAHASILLDGNYLYLNTGNGVDNTHVHIRAPEAPSLIVLDKKTGRLVAQDNERIGPRIFHSTWSSPSLGEVNGRRLVFFAGGDAVCYAFQALPPLGPVAPVKMLERVWRFDCDPTAPKENVHQYHRNRKVSPSDIKGMPVFYKNRLYVTGGGDIWWGKEEAWLKCIDATQEGDVTKTAELWTYPLNRHTCSTPAISNGLVFVADFGRTVHCVDAETGQGCWTHDLGRDTFGSALAADGKVYIGSRRGDFFVLAADREKRVLSSIRLDSPIASTPTAANGVLYVASLSRLYAIQQGAGN